MGGEPRIGILGRLKLVIGRCPVCGARLARVEARDESFVHTHRTRVDLFDQPHQKHVPRIEHRVIPVYSACPVCGFRIRGRDLTEPA
jgi:hypothetical protein